MYGIIFAAEAGGSRRATAAFDIVFRGSCPRNVNAQGHVWGAAKRTGKKLNHRTNRPCPEARACLNRRKIGCCTLLLSGWIS